MKIRKIIVALAAVLVPFLEPKNGEHYLTFYNAFGSANTMSAGYTVVLPIEDTDKAAYFNDADGFQLVLQKNELTGEWVRS